MKRRRRGAPTHGALRGCGRRAQAPAKPTPSPAGRTRSPAGWAGSGCARRWRSSTAAPHTCCWHRAAGAWHAAGRASRSGWARSARQPTWQRATAPTRAMRARSAAARRCLWACCTRRAWATRACWWRWRHAGCSGCTHPRLWAAGCWRACWAARRPSRGWSFRRWPPRWATSGRRRTAAPTRGWTRTRYRDAEAARRRAACSGRWWAALGWARTRLVHWRGGRRGWRGWRASRWRSTARAWACVWRRRAQAWW
mmetsp:Transcript_32460/g.80475  ORF Transcript_32460/g.80475 Transcript_32460/m.80475 type:complete len:254 (+) Transcript_32460:365-1126(+)